MIVLGFYFHTDKGKKLPRRKRDGTYYDPEADKEEKNRPKSAQEKEDDDDKVMEEESEKEKEP